MDKSKIISLIDSIKRNLTDAQDDLEEGNSKQSIEILFFARSEIDKAILRIKELPHKNISTETT